MTSFLPHTTIPFLSCQSVGIVIAKTLQVLRLEVRACVKVFLRSPGLVGLAISYALSVTNLLSGVVTSFTETEKQMVSVERASQYIRGAPQERSDEGRLQRVSLATNKPLTK